VAYPPNASPLNKALSLTAATAIAFLLTLVLSTLLEQFLLFRFTNSVLSTLSSIVILAAVLQAITLVLARRQLLAALVPGMLLPLIFVNCVVMGVTMPNTIEPSSVLVAGLARCTGFAVVLVLFTLLRERLAGADSPAAFQGTATTLVVAAILSMTFMGFGGLG
jgi:electron transport complex protein RnfA